MVCDETEDASSVLLCVKTKHSDFYVGLKNRKVEPVKWFLELLFVLKVLHILPKRFDPFNSNYLLMKVNDKKTVEDVLSASILHERNVALVTKSGDILAATNAGSQDKKKTNRHVSTASKYCKVKVDALSSMAPNVTGSPTSLFLAGAEVICPDKLPENIRVQATPIVTSTASTAPSVPKSEYHWDIVWRNVIAFVYLHSVSLYTVYLVATRRVHCYTFMFAIVLGTIAGLGITAGAHRLWAHKAYKAKWPLRLLLAFFQTVAFQNHIYEWVRDHRVHHKFTDTNADPHNSQRGFFFSHMGWLMVRKHRDVLVKGKTVDMSDLEKDWIVVWQRRLYLILMPLCCFAMPTYVPMYFWGETFWASWNVSVLRYTLSLNFTWLVNSAAHIWGMKPYDRHISPTENISVAVLAMGEGWHNYHHAFPWDYKAAELGTYSLNLTTGFLDACAYLGLAYDLRKASEELVRKRILRSGDGSHHVSQEHSHEGELWGWGDKDMDENEKKLIEVINPAKDE